MNDGAPVSPPEEFSLVAGGPLYQVYLGLGLARPPLDRLALRIVVVAMFAWLPLLLLSLAGAHPSDGGLTFIKDIEAHVRFLIALPLLLAAEPIVHLRLGSAVKQFVAGLTLGSTKG